MTQNADERPALPTDGAEAPDEKSIGASERRAALVGAAAAAAYVTGLGVLLAPAAPVVGVALGSAAAALGALAIGRNKWSPAAALGEQRTVRQLRRQRAVIGAAVPLALVTSQDGECCAYDHVVHRCEPCACVRPCSRFGGRFRAEDRATGRFLVRGAEEVVLVEGNEVRFESTLYERSTSHFHRLDGGERVRIRGDLVETTELPDDARAVLASLRDLPRVLVPRAGTAVLIEKVPPDAGR